jgi:3-oxoacyl-[acyl-carrier-protein] synthase-3
MTAGLEAIGLYIPRNLVRIDELDEIKGLSEEQRVVFDSTMGMETVGVEPELTGVEMAVCAGEHALRESGIEPDSIDLVLYIQSRSPPFLMSSEATHFQHELELTKAFAFSLTDLGCASISSALWAARSFVESGGPVRRVIVAGASQPFGVRRYREAVTVVGDGACAVIVGSSKDRQILDIQLRTDGQFWDLFRVDYRGKPVEEWIEASTNARYKFQMAIMTRDIYGEMNSEMLRRQGVEHPATYVMQNLALSAFDYNEQALNVKFAQACRDNCKQYGHLGGVDIPLNIDRLIRNGEVTKGDLVMVQNNSPSACWSSMLLRM